MKKFLKSNLKIFVLAIVTVAMGVLAFTSKLYQLVKAQKQTTMIQKKDIIILQMVNMIIIIMKMMKMITIMMTIMIIIIMMMTTMITNIIMMTIIIQLIKLTKTQHLFQELDIIVQSI